MIQAQETLQQGLTQDQNDQRVFDLCGEYCPGRINRREFFARSSVITVAGVSGLTMAEALLPRYARAQTISFTDSRLKAQYVSWPSPGGNGQTMRGYLVRPAGAGPFSAGLVVHADRGRFPPGRRRTARPPATRRRARWQGNWSCRLPSRNR